MKTKSQTKIKNREICSRYSPEDKILPIRKRNHLQSKSKPCQWSEDFQNDSRKETRAQSWIRVWKKKITWLLYLKELGLSGFPNQKLNLQEKHKGNPYQTMALKASWDSEPSATRRVWGYRYLGSPSGVQFLTVCYCEVKGSFNWTYRNKYSICGL